MPYQTECPRCSRVGLVRVEHVIKGASSTKAYYCGACDFGWDIPDAAAALPKRETKSKTRQFGSKLNKV